MKKSDVGSVWRFANATDTKLGFDDLVKFRAGDLVLIIETYVVRSGTKCTIVLCQNGRFIFTGRRNFDDERNRLFERVE